MTYVLLILIYLSFIGLGMPNALLGTAWPEMHLELGVPVSYSGAVSMILSGGTVIASLLSDRITRLLGTGRQNAFSAALIALSLFGFSISNSYIAICLWAAPLGFGMGSIDTSLNNYVAHHYSSRYMSWLHCMWGIGSTLGPYIMGAILAANKGWSSGYFTVGGIQLALTALFFFTLPLWKKQRDTHASSTVEEVAAAEPPASFMEILRQPKTPFILLIFFSYCTIEMTIALWSSTYMVMERGYSADAAANFVSVFFIGISIGRALAGFLAIRMSNKAIIRLGVAFCAVGLLSFLLPLGETVTLVAFVLIGLGCAPIHPFAIRSTPDYFAPRYSQPLIGIETASAFMGNLLMPPVFGLIAEHISIALFPYFLMIFLVLEFVMHEKLIRH